MLCMASIVSYTSCHHLYFTDVKNVPRWKVNDDISKQLWAVVTLQFDSRSKCHFAWILTTQRVVPQDRLRVQWTFIRQTDHKIGNCLPYTRQERVK